MKLFISQSDYDNFNRKMSEALNVNYISKILLEENNYLNVENKRICPWNKGLKQQQVAWNKGLTKENDSRIISIQKSEEHKKKISKTLMGHEVTSETREKISKMKKGKPAWNKGKKINSENMRRVKVTNGIQIFNSVKEAAICENVSSSEIIRRIKKGKNWNYINN